MSAETTGQVDLTGKVSMVTGAAGGMGRVIATELSRLGSTV
jgi:NAD(P)-dependent dehydrogenase (short-subunit alcohol dehydrogenase family)